MRNPFEVGGHYRNRIGSYEVLSTEDDQMTILYENGRVQTVSIPMQARIWENIQLDVNSPKSKSSSVNFAEEGLDSWPIKQLVQDVLDTFIAPHPNDVLDRVFLASEGNPGWLTRYHQLIEHFGSQGKNGKLTVNSSIGWYTKDLTGMVTLDTGNSANSTLVGSYSTLAYAPEE